MSYSTISETNSKMGRKRYSETFKINSVQLLEQGNRTQQALASELGISVLTLGQWKRRHGDAVVQARFAEGKKGRNAGSPVATAFECARLQRELNYMTRQRDILKKALGIFSQQPPPSTR